jgi:hypothetical protein
MGTFSSCKKTLEKDFQNPEKVTEGSLGKLFGGMYLNKRIHPSYWDLYTMTMSTTGFYGGFVATPPSAQMYVPNTSYTENRWIDFYEGSLEQDYNYNGPGIMSNYREMQKAYATLSEAEQAKYAVFMKAAEVILYDQAAQMVDLWGDIPFTQAGSLNATGSISVAPFDDAAGLYDLFIAKLDSVNTFFANSPALAGAVSSEFSRQDMMYAGDMASWRRFTNSLRLRLLMRISNASPDKAQPAITAMLSDAATYPLIDDNKFNALVKQSPTNVKSDMVDVFSSFGIAPEYLMQTVMRANGDPRTELFFDENTITGWVGFPYNGTTADYQAVRKYATYDSALFNYNYNMPGILFTAAEVSFLKAEAAERFGVGAAQTEYENGVRFSVNFWKDMYSKIYFAEQKNALLAYHAYVAPTDADITTYLTSSEYAFAAAGKSTLEKIYTQKWINYVIMQSGQAWAEVRRTGYPQLQFVTASTADAALPPTRLLYPASEQLYNKANYEKVAAKNFRDTKIFWDVN